MPADGSVDGVATTNTATAGSGNKRKRVTKDDDEVPKAKRGAKAKEAKNGIKVEDVYENLEENGEDADVDEGVEV